MKILSAPHSGIDLWDPAVLQNPYGVYAELRDMGAAVYLDGFDMWAIPRYAQVREVLGNWQRFTSTQGTAMNDQANKMVIGNIISEDPPMHDRMRSVLAEQLSPRAVLGLKEDIENRVDSMADRLVAGGEFDFVTEFAEPLVMRIVNHLIGLDESDWEALPPLVNSIFTVYGPDNAHTRENFDGAKAFYEYCVSRAGRDRLRPGSWGAAIYQAADAGVIPQEQCTDLITAYVGAGIDTTVAVMAATVWLLSQHPDQWEALREEPELLRNAISEALRLEGPVQCFSRVALEDYRADDVLVPAGSRLVVLYASANRDERRWEKPDAFDIRRNTTGHVGFGYGLHACVGQSLARLESEAVIGALLRRVRRLEAGKPVIRHNNIVRGMAHLPLRVET